MRINDPETVAHIQEGAKIAYKAAGLMADDHHTIEGLTNVATTLRLLAVGLDAIVIADKHADH